MVPLRLLLLRRRVPSISPCVMEHICQPFSPHACSRLFSYVATSLAPSPRTPLFIIHLFAFSLSPALILLCSALTLCSVNSSIFCVNTLVTKQSG